MSDLVPGYDALPEEHDTPESWTPEQKSVYSRMFMAMTDNPGVFQHPDGPDMEDEHWGTVAHNASWLAAEMLDPDSPDLQFTDEDTGETLAYIKMQKRNLS